MFYLLFILGLLIRLFLIPFPGFKADMAFWKGWGLAIADKGIIWTVQNTNYNYPPGFAYVLYAVNKVYALLASPYNNAYWQDTNVLYLFLFKIITIAADIVIVILILKITKKLNSKLGLILSLIYFLNPISIYDGVFWGQVDQFGLMLFLGALYALMKDKKYLASIIFSVSCLMKFQNIIFIPLFYLFIWRKYSWSTVIRSILYSFCTFVVISFPFILERKISLLIRLLTINNNYFPFMSLNAFNGWWLFSGLNGMGMIDTKLVFGVINARTFSFLCFIVIYALLCYILMTSKRELLIRRFIVLSSVLVFAFFHVLTQSHERYMFHLVGFIPLLIAFEEGQRRKRMLMFYLVFSFFFFFNLYITMYYSYPDLVIWPFSSTATRSITAFISVVQIGFFVCFLYLAGAWHWMVRNKRNTYAVGIAGAMFVVILFIKNIPLMLRLPISLTTLRPMTISQDYQIPLYNKNLNSILSIFQYDRVSSNYFFYNRAIAAHANSIITYDLNSTFSRLKTDYGIDTEGTANAEVIYRVEGDGRELFRSKKMGRYDIPGTLDVSVAGVKTLALIIEKTGTSNYGHHADWLNPVVIR